MDPRQAFCPFFDCPARGQVGRGNIHIHSQKEKRYRRAVCGRTFSARQGTIFYRRRVAEDLIPLVVTLVAYGCPIPAIVAAFGFQARTVRQWVEAAGLHGEKVHHPLRVQPRDLRQVQAAEIRAKIQGGVLWLALALMVPARLWRGGQHPRRQGLDPPVGESDPGVCLALAPPRQRGWAGGLGGGLAESLSFPQRTGKAGWPRLLPWRGGVIG